MVIFIALLSAFAWSIFDLKRKLLVAQVPSLPLALWLSVWVIPVYLALSLYSSHPWPASSYWLPAVGSLLVSSAAALSFITALRVGQIALLMPVLALTPVVSAVLSYIWLGEGLSARELLAMMTIVFLLFLLHGGARFRWRAGTGYMLIVAMGWGSGTVFDRWALAYAQPYVHALLQSIGMLILFTVFLLFRGEIGQAAVNRIPIKRIVFAAFFFVVAVLAQLYALQDLHAGIIESIKRGIGTLGALVWGIYIFKEDVKRSQLVLVLLLVIAIAWLVWPS